MHAFSIIPTDLCYLNCQFWGSLGHAVYQTKQKWRLVFCESILPILFNLAILYFLPAGQYFDKVFSFDSGG